MIPPKPKIAKDQFGFWFVIWPDGAGWWSRRCYTWHVAVEQCRRLYADGTIPADAENWRARHAGNVAG